ncbi:DUF397 domain-containing protein [Streptomyces smyrnaeus]|uniref:DUF397 domain-containing protein n=1 Tax=Streptomyces smyrnaeus TaxID=1387713 RepID=UPI00368870DF
MNNSENPRARWFKSSYSNGQANCVEVRLGGDVSTRDSKQADGPVLSFGAEQWAAFVAGVADGQLGR